jgi:hypothetical protein
MSGAKLLTGIAAGLALSSAYQTQKKKKDKKDKENEKPKVPEARKVEKMSKEENKRKAALIKQRMLEKNKGKK